MPPEPSESMLSRIYSSYFKKKRKTDINLPNESGRVDPRLKRPDVRGAIGKAKEGYGILRKKGIF